MHQIEGELVDSPTNTGPSSPGDTLHIAEEDANLLVGSLTNDYNKKIVKVNSIHHLCHPLQCLCLKCNQNTEYKSPLAISM